MDELRQTETLRGYAPEDRRGFDEVEERPGGLRRIALLSALVVVLFGFAGIVWYAYEQYRISAGDGQVPLVRADSDPVRVRPDDPGGLEVPHRDRLVLEEPRQPGSDEDGGEAAVLPPPEEPIARPEVADAGTLSSSELPVFAVEPSAGGIEARPDAGRAAADRPEALISRNGGAQESESPSVAPAVPAITVVENVAVGLITGGALPLEAPPVRLARAEPFGRQPGGPAGRIEIAEMTVGQSPPPRRAPRRTEEPVEAAAQQPELAAPSPPELAAPPPEAQVPTAEMQAQPAVESPPPEDDPAPAPVDPIAAVLQDAALQSAAMAPTTPDRTYRVQLAAVNSDQAARTGWEEFTGSYPDLLGSLELFVQVVEVNGRTYHRIQGGMLDRDGARTLCQELRDRGTDCIVRP